jgi:hypothetical protein
MKAKSFVMILVILGIWALFIPHALAGIEVTEKIKILPHALGLEFNMCGGDVITRQFIRDYKFF